MVVFGQSPTGTKWAFVHIPKTGGTSVLAALIPFLKEPKGPRVPPKGKLGWQNPWHRASARRFTTQHDTVASTGGGVREFKGRLIFTVGRSPYSRFESLWNAFCPKHPPKPEDVLKASKRVRLCRPQVYWLEPLLSRVRILRFENLAFEMMCLLLDLGYALPENWQMPHENSRPCRNNEFYYQEHGGLLRQAVRSVYDKDFEWLSLKE